MKRKKRKIAKRNPIARVVKKIRPQVVPDTRRKKLAHVKEQEIKEEIET